MRIMKTINKSNNKKFFGRKGQITIFIILGIIILFAVALVVYVKNSYNTVRPPVQELVVDEQVRPIQLYVTDCLNTISKEALVKLGQSGGYIEFSGMKVDIRPYQSDVLVSEPLYLPYWYYDKSCEQSSLGCLVIRNPPVCSNSVKCVLPYQGDNSMEEQLNHYVENNMNKCLDFTSFSDRFDITPGNITADTIITEDSVSFKIDYPLTIAVKGTGKVDTIPYFYTMQDVKLKHIYQLAEEIRDAEANYTFLERNTLNLISVYSGVDSDKLPPMSGLDMFVNTKKYWIRSEVKDKLMSDVLPYTMLLQIANAGNAHQLISREQNPKYIPFEEGLYKSMMLKVSNNSYFDLNANIYYPGSDIYFSIGNEEIIKPKTFDAGNSIFLKMLNFAVNDYSFRYDLSYPVVVTISDPSAFKGEGYTFNYAMEATIRQNVPVSENITTVNIFNQPSVSLESSLQKTNRTITITTYDKYTKQALDGVIISYTCGDKFTIGQTTIKDGKAVLQDRFPYCELGGEIDYEKPGYMGGAIDFNNPDGTDPKDFRIELWPLQDKRILVYKRTDADINKIRYSGTNGILLYTTAYTNITANDTVFLTVQKLKEDPRESDVPVVGFTAYKTADSQTKTVTLQDQQDYINKMYTDGLINDTIKQQMLNDLSSYPLTATTTQGTVPQEYTMEFVPGQYSIDAFMLYSGTVNIPAEDMHICAVKIAGVCVSGEKTITLPAQSFNSWMNGGININMTLSESDVYSNSSIVIFVAETPLPKNWDDLQNAPSIEQYEQDKLSLLRPTIVYG